MAKKSDFQREKERHARIIKESSSGFGDLADHRARAAQRLSDTMASWPDEADRLLEDKDGARYLADLLLRIYKETAG